MSKKDTSPNVFLFPAPIVLVSSGDMEHPNIITIAWAGVLCSNPPLLGVSIRPNRYSYDIIRRNKDFVINIPSSEQENEVQICGTKSGKNVDKFKLCNFTPIKGKVVDSPIIKECRINIECKLNEIKPLGVHHLFVGEIVNVKIDEDSVTDKFDLIVDKIKPMSFFGGDYYKIS